MFLDLDPPGSMLIWLSHGSGSGFSSNEIIFLKTFYQVEAEVLFLPSGGRAIIPTRWRLKYYSYLAEVELYYSRQVEVRSIIPTWWRPSYYSYLVEAKVLFLPGGVRIFIPT
jgi:hypothetical protein